ncbi:hypothetical protein CPE01_08810 [Cellulomonas persica]|uniref:Uncharacterized protein n=1 Tax=Cellulomonas persica TaxID=76861 RepID=A0A510UR65_9CELL|nr:hypothetical protein CPE01_08810 [Cellulomonas persica]
MQRAARRVLAFPAARRVVVAVGRRAPRVKDAGKVLLGVEAGGSRHLHGKPRVDIRGGHMLLPHQGRRWPIVLVVALGLEPGDTEVVADAIERVQLTTGRFRPLFLVDSGQLGPFRSRSYAVETVMPRAMYACVNPQDSYGDYLADRTQSIVHAYGVRSVVPVSVAALRDGVRPDELRLLGQLEL